MYYPCGENKGADQLRGYREADLRLCFRICKSRFSHDTAHFLLRVKRMDFSKQICLAHTLSFEYRLSNIANNYGLRMQHYSIQIETMIYSTDTQFGIRNTMYVLVAFEVTKRQ